MCIFLSYEKCYIFSAYKCGPKKTLNKTYCINLNNSNKYNYYFNKHAGQWHLACP